MPGRMILACWFEGAVQTSPDDVGKSPDENRRTIFSLNIMLQSHQTKSRRVEFLKSCIAICESTILIEYHSEQRRTFSHRAPVS